ncbi:MAG: aminoacetone oxidase family FAD-binding enzyme, partial [Clostridia bacterium]|nr:aminoacetone oxidase family FAD-binding enzyme [Clostridia bacterium]
DGRRVQARCALVCTGGLAAPKLGASGEGYRLLEGFGHRITPRFPAIAALNTPQEAVRGLKGIRAEGEISLLIDGETARVEAGEVLFGEAGISGIAAMQLARQANEALRAGRACAARLNLMPDTDIAKALQIRAEHLPRRTMENFLNGIVPKRLGQTLARNAGLDMALTADQLRQGQLSRLAELLGGWTLPVTGTQGFDQAQVTAGGASLKDFDARRMRSLRAPGLFAAGEVLDVDGDCGGFNLQWAWSSALMAAEGIEAALEK